MLTFCYSYKTKTLEERNVILKNMQFLQAELSEDHRMRRKHHHILNEALSFNKVPQLLHSVSPQKFAGWFKNRSFFRCVSVIINKSILLKIFSHLKFGVAIYLAAYVHQIKFWNRKRASMYTANFNHLCVWSVIMLNTYTNVTCLIAWYHIKQNAVPIFSDSFFLLNALIPPPQKIMCELSTFKLAPTNW